MAVIFGRSGTFRQRRHKIFPAASKVLRDFHKEEHVLPKIALTYRVALSQRLAGYTGRLESAKDRGGRQARFT